MQKSSGTGEAMAASALLLILVLGSAFNFVRAWGQQTAVDEIEARLDGIGGRLDVQPADVQRDVRKLTEIVQNRTQKIENFDAFVSDYHKRTRDRIYRQQVEDWIEQLAAQNESLRVPILPEADQ